MIVTDLLASIYVLCDNATKEELDLAVCLELFGSVINIMRQEQILGNLDDMVIKEQVTFSDTTGIVDNTFTDWGDAIYLEFNGDVIEECPVSQLDLFANQGLQRVAFWTEVGEFTNTLKIQLAIPQMGTLKVWYEPDVAELNQTDAPVNFPDALRWAIATRVAKEAVNYTKYKSPLKMANRPNLAGSLSAQADHWTKIYLTKINKIGTGRPFSRLPFSAGTTNG